VHGDPGWVGASTQTGGQLATGRRQQAETFFACGLQESACGERLDRVQRARKRGCERAASGADVVLVGDEQRGSVLGGEFLGRQATDLEAARAKER
jgi:hypothetical protein